MGGIWKAEGNGRDTTWAYHNEGSARNLGLVGGDDTLAEGIDKVEDWIEGPDHARH